MSVGKLQTYAVPMTLSDALQAVMTRQRYPSLRAAREGLVRGRKQAKKADAALAELPLPREVRPAAV